MKSESVRDALRRVRAQYDAAETERKRVAILAVERGASLREIAEQLGLSLGKTHALTRDEVSRPKRIDPLSLPIKEAD